MIEHLLHASLLRLKADPKVSTRTAEVKHGAYGAIALILLEKDA
jgi:hypothetical protein